MTKSDYQPFELGDWLVEPELDRISRSGAHVAIQPKAMELLVYLARNNGHVVSTDEILNDLWSDVVVASGSVYVCVSHLREALGDHSRNPRYIETIPKRGYRLVADIQAADVPSDTDAMQPALPPTLTSIAVLPMKNLSGRPEHKYFAAGMQDALIADLSKLSALKVISRTSTQQYEDTEKALPQIGAELGVDLLVEGLVYQVGNRVRITVQLIVAATDDHLWAESYERGLTDILRLQSELALAIANQISITVTPKEEALLADVPRIDPDTYNAYLQGMYFVNKATPEETAKGLATLAGAVESDPTNALAWAGLALAHVQAAHAPDPPPGAYIQAKTAAMKALELDDRSAEAYAARAECRMYNDWDWRAAEADFHKALHLNANLTATRAHYSFYLNLFGHNDLALAQMKRTLEIDPLTPLWPAWLAWQYWEIGQPEAAIDHARKSLELAPNFPVGFYVLGSALATIGAYEEAIAAHKKASAISPNWDLGLGEALALAGRQDEARQVLARMEASAKKWDTFFIARTHLALGDKDGGLRWLEAACEKQAHPFVPWIKSWVSFDSLRDDPRFKDLLNRMNLPL